MGIGLSLQTSPTLETAIKPDNREEYAPIYRRKIRIGDNGSVGVFFAGAKGCRGLREPLMALPIMVIGPPPANAICFSADFISFRPIDYHRPII